MGQLNAAIVPVTPFEQNCTVLFDTETKAGVVVDPGGDVERILERIRDNKLDICRSGSRTAISTMPAAQWTSRTRSASTSSARTRPIARCSTISRTRRSASGWPARCATARPTASSPKARPCRSASMYSRCCIAPAMRRATSSTSTARRKFAHVGDVLFRGSVGRTDLPGGDHAALIRSIKEKLLPLGDDIGFICGHGPGSRFGDERRGNPYLV